MKEFFFRHFLLMSLSVLLFTGCDPKENEAYLNPARASLSFLGEGSEPQSLKVSASAEWSAEPMESWIVLGEKSADAIAVSVTDNDADVERSGKIVLKSGNLNREVVVIQQPKESVSPVYRRLDEFPKMSVISPNGKYVGGVMLDVDEMDAFIYTPVVINVETDERYLFGPYPEALLTVLEVKAVTDTGLLFVEDTDGATVLDIKTSEFVKMGIPSGFDFRPCVTKTSSDGSVLVGYNLHEGLYKPLKWVNDTIEFLQMPEKNYRGEDFQVGIMARGCSGDGSVIYGTTWDNRDFGMIYWDKAGEWHWVGEDVRKVTPVQMKNWENKYEAYNLVDGMTSESASTQMSYGGKYIAGTFRTEELADDDATVLNTRSAAFYNTETKKTKIFAEYGESVGLGAMDNGVGFIGLGWLGVSSGVVVDIETGTQLGTMQQWIKDNYGIVVSTGYVEYMCKDGAAFMGVSAQAGAAGTTFVSWYVAPPLKK